MHVVCQNLRFAHGCTAGAKPTETTFDDASVTMSDTIPFPLSKSSPRPHCSTVWRRETPSKDHLDSEEKEKTFVEPVPLSQVPQPDDSNSHEPASTATGLESFDLGNQNCPASIYEGTCIGKSPKEMKQDLLEDNNDSQRIDGSRSTTLTAW